MIIDTYKTCPQGHLSLKWDKKGWWYCKICNKSYHHHELVVQTDFWEERDDRINNT